MVTYTAPDGEQFELPKLTIALQEEMEDAPKGSNTKEQVKSIMAFLKKVLPEEYVTEALGGDKPEEVDLVALRNLYDGVDSAYTMAMTASQMRSINAQMDSVAPVLENIAKVGNLQTRQGFKRVK